MYTNYEIENGKVIAYGKSDEGTYFSESMKLCGNIKEILISKNNIEKMEDFINNFNKQIKEDKKSRLTGGIIYLPQSVLWGANAILRIILKDELWIAILYGTNCILQGGIGLSRVLVNNNYIKINKKKIEFIKDRIKEENKKLDLLYQADDNCNYLEQSATLPNKSEEIYKLENQLNVLCDYVVKRKKFIKYYKKGMLDKILHTYYEGEIEILKEFIHEDLEKEKQKTLTR